MQEISSQDYIRGLEDKTVEELLEERKRLEKEMSDLSGLLFNEGAPNSEIETKIETDEQYLKELVKLIGEKQGKNISYNGFFDEMTTDVKYNDIPVKITFDIEAGEQHFPDDYALIERIGIENIIREKYLPWLKGDNDSLDDEQLMAGLKLYEITYQYSHISADSNPRVKKDGNYGQFEFCFNCGNDYCKNVFEAVAMEIYILDGEIANVTGFDI